MKIKLSECAQIAEIVSAVAIVLSLIFVGFQLKDNARATRSATANAATAPMIAWYGNVGQNQQTSALLYNNIGKDPDTVDPDEWFQFVMSMHAQMLIHQNNYYLVEEGTLELEIRDSLAQTLSAIKDQPGFIRFWQQRKSIFFPEFQRYIDELLASSLDLSSDLYDDVPTE